MSKNKAKKSRFTQKQINWFVISGFLAVIVLIYDFNVAGNIKFYANWVQCGQRPVGTRSKGFFGSGVAHYVEQPLISGFRDVIDYKCSPLNAERDGFSANSEVFDFPNLRAIGEYSKEFGEW